MQNAYMTEAAKAANRRTVKPRPFSLETANKSKDSARKKVIDDVSDMI